MGRNYVADGTFQQQIDTLISRNESFVGLIIGQMQFSSSKDLVVRLVPTPAAPCETDTETASIKCLSVDAIDDRYIANHARQTLRMLTGGFDVIGAFACVSPDEVKNVQVRLRQILFTVHKTLNKVDSLMGGSVHTERLLLQICRLTRKLTCRMFDVADPKSAGNPCEFKFQKTVDNFLPLQTKFSLDFIIPVPTEMMSSSLQKQIMVGLQPVFQNISNSIAVINGRIMPDGDPLCQQTAGRAKGKRQRTSDVNDRDNSAEEFLVELLLESPLNDVPETSVFSCCAKMMVRGTIASKAYATGKAAVADAVQMLKRDIVRSIVARCELLCEDLLQAEEEQDVKILYETPLRVFTKLPEHEPVEFCDYLFPDETVSDSADRFRELLGFEVSSEEIDAEAEHMPSESDLAKPSKPVRPSRRSAGDQSQAAISQHMYKYVGVASSLILASFAVLVSYWYSVSPDQL